jgi:hypothetical protein
MRESKSPGTKDGTIHKASAAAAAKMINIINLCSSRSRSRVWIFSTTVAMTLSIFIYRSAESLHQVRLQHPHQEAKIHLLHLRCYYYGDDIHMIKFKLLLLVVSCQPQMFESFATTRTNRKSALMTLCI